MPDPVVTVNAVSKKYCRSLKRGMLYSMADVCRDAIGVRSASEKLRDGEFWAVSDVSFALQSGECIGLIGANGAGKSTLLKMLNGIIRPDTGSIRMAGRVGALIEVGAGFHPLLTGRENVYVNGAILGMGRREIDRKFDAIVEFSGLDSGMLDAPVKTYSSGMYVRLGFSVAAHCEPDILLIDEVLAVGDVTFQSACLRKLHELRKEGKTFILVSHNLVAIQEHCTRAIVFEKGRAAFVGSASEAVVHLRGQMARAEAEAARVKGAERDGEARGATGATLLGVEFIDSRGAAAQGAACGERLRIRARIRYDRAVEEPVVRFGLKSLQHNLYTTLTSDAEGARLAAAGPGEAVVEMDFAANMPAGAYSLGVLIADGHVGNPLAWDWQAGLFTIAPHVNQRGDLYCPGSWSLDPERYQ
ncbi:MAG TPA: ABC transporter ATP-binding protein [Chthonomonadaceae bacterium]|nr:ABC transporter ATP-binding protein [Chthonomonadaceae bacterium]